MLNLYSTVSDVKSRLSITVTTYDALLEALLENVSRLIDDECHRHFFTKTETMYCDTAASDLLIFPDDLISITTLTTDSEADGSYDGETLSC